MRKGSWIAGIAALLWAASGVAAAGEPARRFEATAHVKSSQGTRSMPITIVVTRYTPVNETQHLREVLESGGQGALLSLLKTRQDGYLEMGALRRNISLAVAEEVDGDWTYIFLTARHIDISESERGLESLDYPFGAAVVRVDHFGRGEGDLHVTAALRIAADGQVEVVDLDGTEGWFRDFKALNPR